jgi:hypothetical protein
MVVHPSAFSCYISPQSEAIHGTALLPHVFFRSLQVADIPATGVSSMIIIVSMQTLSIVLVMIESLAAHLAATA